jgi:hypothetical protein
LLLIQLPLVDSILDDDNDDDNDILENGEQHLDEGCS